MLGIVTYGFYVPQYRIKIEEIARVWGKNPEEVKKSLAVMEKAVASNDEDSLTMGYESAQMALEDVEVDRRNIKIVFFGSETHPYAVNPASTIMAEFLGIEKDYLAYDTEFACKAATGAMISGFGLIKSGYCPFALITGADKGSAKPHDPLEYTAASGAVSLLLGNSDVILEVIDYSSYSSDTPDFWRREGIRYPSHGGRFTGKPSYYYHIQENTKNLLKKNHLTPEDFAYVIFHMPNGKFPREVARTLGFHRDQVEPGLVVDYLGNSYTASSLMGLVAVLEFVRPGQLILLVSYGSGAGSDGFIFRTTKKIVRNQKKFRDFIARKTYIDYPQYLKFMEFI